jgi:hypothetical protein
MGNRTSSWIPVVIVAGLILFGVYYSMSSDESESPLSDLPTPELREGYRLSQAYCVQCHTYAEPDLLPKETWENETLPAMGALLGIYEHNGNRYPVQNTPGLPEGYYPDEAQITAEDWQRIIDYYVYTAPASFPNIGYNPEIRIDSSLFHIHTPDYPAGRAPVITSGVIDTRNRIIFTADAYSNQITAYDSTLSALNSTSIPSPISDLRILEPASEIGKTEFLITYVGHLNPSDLSLGSVVRGNFDYETGRFNLNLEILADSLTRPVEAKLADLTGDGNHELLVAEFGHTTGRLSWYEFSDNEPVKNVLISTPGCIQSHIMDFTGNGLNDILALCAQLDQAIYLFKNEGNGNFSKEKLLQFNIAAGSSSFELYDFNDDGHPDILYTSGDNADFSKIFKPYHGVYLYLNDGAGNFTPDWFYPINGAFSAKPIHADGDTLIDIAVSAFFANFSNRPQEGFILFKNEGGGSFTPYHHPETRKGRWIRMDIADWNGDQKEDILLSNFSIGPVVSDSPFTFNWSRGPAFMVLEQLPTDP